jgi:hypothetical protein
MKLADHRCRLTAAVVFAVFSNATSTWSQGGFREDFAKVVDREFDLMRKLSGEWSRSGANLRARARKAG